MAKYISLDSPKYAILQVKKIFKRIEILNSFPNAGRFVPEQKRKIHRELIIGNYRIIYRIVKKSEIYIVSVHHSKKRLSNL